MDLKKINPASVGEAPTYTHGILTSSAGRTLYIAGQVGADASGACSSDIATQCRQAWSRIEAILAEAGMTLENVVKTTVYLLNREDYATFVEVRKSVLKGHKPASTLVFVSGLAKPEFKV